MPDNRTADNRTADTQRASQPPDQTETPPSQRTIGESLYTDGPNGQNSTPPMQTGLGVSSGTALDDEALETE
jgi:hypothetical protein